MNLALRKRAQVTIMHCYLEVGFDDSGYRTRDVIGGVLANICEGVGGHSSTDTSTPPEVRRAVPIGEDWVFRYVQFSWGYEDSRDVAAKLCYDYLEEKQVAHYMITWRAGGDGVFDVEVYDPEPPYEPLIEEE